MCSNVWLLLQALSSLEWAGPTSLATQVTWPETLCGRSVTALWRHGPACLSVLYRTAKKRAGEGGCYVVPYRLLRAGGARGRKGTPVPVRTNWILPGNRRGGASEGWTMFPIGWNFGRVIQNGEIKSSSSNSFLFAKTIILTNHNFSFYFWHFTLNKSAAMKCNQQFWKPSKIIFCLQEQFNCLKRDWRALASLPDK